MLNKYDKEIELLLEWYERAKEVVIIAESLDPSNTAYIQPLHEQRYSFDHFLRAVNYEKNDQKESNDNEKNVVRAINSAIAHLQRAYSDAIEWMLVSVKDEYIRVLQPYTNTQIKDVFPEYYGEIREGIEAITEVINEYKFNKSVEKAVNSDIFTEEELQKLGQTTDRLLLMDVVNRLKNYVKLLHNKEKLLIEIKERENKQFWKEKVIIPIITAVIAGIVVALITV